MATQTYLYLTTTDRITGKEEETELRFVGYQNAFYVLYSGDMDAWLLNMRENPRVWYKLGSPDETPTEATAREVDIIANVELAQAVQSRFDAQYQGVGNYGLMIEIQPVLME